MSRVAKSKKTAAPMRNSFLVQRLNRPIGGTILGRDNPFSFGGGLRNGGLSGEAMGLLRDIFSFDYMGSAEFEWGAVPEALQGIAKRTDLAAFTFTIPLATVPPSWRAKSKVVPSGDATLYVLAPAAWADEVKARIVDWAAGNGRLKEGLHLTGALRPADEHDERTAGWLEMNNGFFFFTDQTMWEKTCNLFGVTPEAKS